MTSGVRGSRWPNVIGTIGIVVAAIMFLDKVEDLSHLLWTAEDWRRLFSPDIADLIVRATPPLVWRLGIIAAELALAVLLIIGSVALRRRRRSGVSLSRVWAWLAIVWVVLIMARGVWWLLRFQGEIVGIPYATWQGFAVLGILMALALLLAWPVFLLVWFARPEIRAEVAEWPD